MQIRFFTSESNLISALQIEEINGKCKSESKQSISDLFPHKTSVVSFTVSKVSNMGILAWMNLMRLR